MLLAAGIVVLGRGAWIQVVRADDVAAAASVSEQADGGYRFEHNPRLLDAARGLVRGTIYDRNGLPLATSRPDEIASMRTIYRASGIAPASDCEVAQTRCYPLGGYTFHLLGDWNAQTNWAARNSSYIERDSDAQLKGYDDHASDVEVVNPRTGKRHAAISRDYRELLPLVRHRYWLRSAKAEALRTRNRDVHTSIDARLQIRASTALRDQIVAGKNARGAAVVIDPFNGDVLASASYPWPSPGANPPDDSEASERRGEQLLDRARYGLYPPGSVFKLLIAGAALSSGGAGNTYSCLRLPDGRVGNYIRGSSRPVRDDPMDTVPHGPTRAARRPRRVVQCLLRTTGTGPRSQSRARGRVGVPDRCLAPGDRRGAERLAAPCRIRTGAGGRVALEDGARVRVDCGRRARTSASLAGRTGTATEPQRFLAAADASRLGKAMRDVVLDGTGRAVKGNRVPIAGKTGTAEIAGGGAHSWFTGFAPYGGSGPQIAFAVLVENAGYGARSAAPVAGELVTAAKDFGLIK